MTLAEAVDKYGIDPTTIGDEWHLTWGIVEDPQRDAPAEVGQGDLYVIVKWERKDQPCESLPNYVGKLFFWLAERYFTTTYYFKPLTAVLAGERTG